MIPAERIVAEMLGDEQSADADPSPEDFDELVKGYHATQARIGGRPLNLVPAGVEDHQILRVVRVLRRYTLAIWDTYRREDHHSTIGYRFTAPGGTVLFQGEDLHIPGASVVDSNDVIKDLLGWLVLKPGDTDDEFFENYTPLQLQFAEGEDAEEISFYTRDDSDIDPEGEYDISHILQDVPGYEHGEDAE